MQEVMDKIFQRWGHESAPPMQPHHYGEILSISIGLGSLFNESAEAERHWMQSQHSAFKTRPITMVFAGRIRDVLDQVNKERNL